MRRTLRFEDLTELFRRNGKSEAELTEKIASAKRLASVRYTSRDLITIASLTSSLKVEGHRADLVILKAA